MSALVTTMHGVPVLVSSRDDFDIPRNEEIIQTPTMVTTPQTRCIKKLDTSSVTRNFITCRWPAAHLSSPLSS
jgi:hypothetical protein